MVTIRQLPFELAAWICALLYLSLLPPANFSICLFHQLGFQFCPGCGLGHSIYFIFHGQLKQSFDAHPFGILAILILFHRILLLSRQLIKNTIKPTS